MNPGAEQTAAIRGTVVQRAERPLGTLGVIALAITALVLAPLVAVIANAFGPGESTWAHLVGTVLPAYLGNTLLLMLGVAYGVVSIGVLAAWLVTAYRFPGRRVLEWALILPLAMPAYVMAYAYTDWLQFTGPVQTRLRALTGWHARDYWFPEIRSLYGAAAMFVVRALSLRLPARAHARSSSTRGARSRPGARWASTARGGFFRVALPLARPAIAAGVALALMETLADFGTVSYFARRDLHHRHLSAPGSRWATASAAASSATCCSASWSLRAGARALESRRRARTTTARRTPRRAARGRAARRCARGRVRRLRVAAARRASCCRSVLLLRWRSPTASPRSTRALRRRWRATASRVAGVTAARGRRSPCSSPTRARLTPWPRVARASARLPRSATRCPAR